MRIYIRWCGFDWCMFVGTWLLNGMDVIKYARDATPVIPPEPIIEIKELSGESIRRLITRLRDLISLATSVAWIKKLGFRVFITDMVLEEPIEDYLKAALAGDVDGLINGVNTQSLITMVNTKPSNSMPGYLVVDAFKGLPLNVDGVYGVILMNAPLDINWITHFKGFVESHYGGAELYVSLGVDGLLGGFIRNLVGLVNGVVITEVPTLVSLGFDDGAAVNVFRCVNCYADYMSNKELRKCPRCGGKLRPVVKSWGKLETMDAKVVRLKARDEISLMKARTPGIVTL